MKKTIVLFFSLFCLFSFSAISVSALEEQNMNIYGLYLSLEGDATLIESDGEWLLVDTGIEDASDELLQKLSDYGVEELDVLISHLHSDHMGGFTALASSDIKISKVYVPDSSLTPFDENTEKKQNKIQNNAQSNNSEVNIIPLKKDSAFSFGDVNAKVLGPVADVTPDDFEQFNDQTPMDHYVNCRSLTVRFDCGETSYISSGDIEAEEEAALVKEYEGTGELDADIMKLNHHALFTSNTKEYLAQVTPKYSFGQNSEKGITEGSDYRMYYNSCENASKYGPVYLVGDEKKDFAVKVTDGKIKVYRGEEQLLGLVALVGGDGTVVKTDKYYITGEDVKEGVYTIDGKKYYISDGGYVNKAFYSFNLGKYVYRYEPVENGDVRYFDLEGVMYTGFRKINDNYFYFNTSTGVLLKGDKYFTPVKIGSNKYAINENGAIYNYNADSGSWKKYGSNYRYFDKNGVMQTGWLTVGDEKYYLNTTTGLRTIGLTEVDGKTYYFVEKNNAGYMYKSGWKKFGSKYRYFSSNGVMKTGWLTVGKKKYYLDKSTGYRTVGLKKISGKTYYFVEKNNAGYMYKSGWKKFGSKYRYFSSNGVMKTGWLKVDGKYYYLNKSTGYRTVGLKKISGKTYYFVEKNKAAYRYSGWKKFGSKKRYFDKNGIMITGKKKINGKIYKFDKNGYLKT